MRYREPFTLFPRKMKSGRAVWYYQTYDENGRRTTAQSTGQTLKTAAKAYCIELYKEDRLIPNKKSHWLFKDYAEGWWIWGKCEYLKYRSRRRPIAESYANTARIILKSRILPTFQNKRMDTITRYDIEKWMVVLSEKGYANLTINLSLSILRVMLKEAVRQGIIKSNPSQDIQALKNEWKKRGILTWDEVSKLFNPNEIDTIWNKRICYLANLLAACTGMRAGEVMGLRGDCLFDGYIRVEKQYNPQFGLTDTKTHDSREIPLPKEINEELFSLREENNNGFLFSLDGGNKPVNRTTIMDSLKEALMNIGISKDEMKERNICFHSWRHYFNTVMRSHNISDGKLQKLTGHRSIEMINHYTHFKADDFKDVLEIQAKIIQVSHKVG